MPWLVESSEELSIMLQPFNNHLIHLCTFPRQAKWYLYKISRFPYLIAVLKEWVISPSFNPQLGGSGAALRRVCTPWLQTNLARLDLPGTEDQANIALRGFMNISGTKATGFQWWAKRFELSFFIRKTSLLMIKTGGRNILSAGQFERFPTRNPWSLRVSLKHMSFTTMTKCRPVNNHWIHYVIIMQDLCQLMLWQVTSRKVFCIVCRWFYQRLNAELNAMLNISKRNGPKEACRVHLLTPNSLQLQFLCLSPRIIGVCLSVCSQ